ncbi:hypothetical protein NVIE_2427 [Nitrososphaera viennensis EN76]|uniref:Uncharacterized protein n=1 Tax=Nitrososphaera viennensis EN76 TaxID=926571 RepID=A0A060HJ86_9ARCH|nr:hypothetical protein NVIE_2427 [Nitrososphaera viennensis EN76]
MLVLSANMYIPLFSISNDDLMASHDYTRSSTKCINLNIYSVLYFEYLSELQFSQK